MPGIVTTWNSRNRTLLRRGIALAILIAFAAVSSSLAERCTMAHAAAGEDASDAHAHHAAPAHDAEHAPEAPIPADAPSCAVMSACGMAAPAVMAMSPGPPFT